MPCRLAMVQTRLVQLIRVRILREMVNLGANSDLCCRKTPHGVTSTVVPRIHNLATVMARDMFYAPRTSLAVTRRALRSSTGTRHPLQAVIRLSPQHRLGEHTST